MKKLIYLLAITVLLSCSKDDDCQEAKDSINAYYDTQVQFFIDNPNPDGIDYRKIGFLNEERNRKLANACD